LGLFWISEPSEVEKYRDALNNPALWALEAEERTAFKTSVTLIEGSIGTFSIEMAPLMTLVLIVFPQITLSLLSSLLL
jgi:hypothetical protein